MVGNLADGRISYFSNMFCLFYLLGGHLKIRVILPIYSMSFFLLRSTTYFFYGDLFLSLPQPPPLLGVGISGICTDEFP